ncbi:uncharacterized protein LOC121262267 isoform X1 [Juglans microcarpa x Juglans regia]|uniref:uncharacterized protein LOC121262267 isoform X1 n=2 Tax=Juglans microcarpa x Juglans regia TaxID=2249226 RepID=UPI001B7E1334|nr:uncharacterized protein LOC121262267 isoform X1 [Juglans microcarpa x Juglans regia]
MSSCPSNSIVFNDSLCACPPGQLLNRTAKNCILFVADSTIVTDSGVEYSIGFPARFFDFDSIRKFTQSQAVFLEATLVMLLSWLCFCFFMRCMKLGDGRTVWFKIRWWISRLDICFSTRHWLNDQKVVVKRKTELGGMFSIASWIVFIGLFAALLYQIISKRSVEVHNIRATNAPDLASFVNDMEFNITTLSSMSCSQLRNLDTLVMGNPGSFDQRFASLSEFANYSCHNTSQGPTITIRCSSCKFIQDNLYLSWHFIDLPNNPATAVGFRFNLTARNQNNKKHVSFVCGTVKNGSSVDDKPVTFRGRVSNILKFNLFPRIYHNLHDLRLMQPLFREFLPGSSFHETSLLHASLQNSNDGLINITLSINLLSAYIVEISNQNMGGPVSFLADLGGLYCISFGIFFYLLVQFEYRIKRLRNEDSILRKIRNRRKAQDRWNKLRKYVMYTWGRGTLDYNSPKEKSSCGGVMVQLARRNRSSLKHSQPKKWDSITFNNKHSLPSEPVKREVLGSTNVVKQHSVGSSEGVSSEAQAFLVADDIITPPPILELKPSSEMDMSDVHENLRSLYEYNVMLREKLVATQSLLNVLAMKSSSPVTENKT